MKMLWIIICTGTAHLVIDALEKSGIHAMTRLDVTGYDRGSGLSGELNGYTETKEEMLMTVLADHDVAPAVRVIRNVIKRCMKSNSAAGTPKTGRIVVTYVDESFTIRTAENSAGTMQV